MRGSIACRFAAASTLIVMVGLRFGMRCVAASRESASAERKARGILESRHGSAYDRGTMVLGMSLSTFTIVHVVLSLAGIFSGLIVVFGLLSGMRLEGWTALFLVTTVATSVTGFGFPFHGFLPPHYVGVVSLVVLLVAIIARYPMHLAGAWRRSYV